MRLLALFLYMPWLNLLPAAIFLIYYSKNRRKKLYFVNSIVWTISFFVSCLLNGFWIRLEDKSIEYMHLSLIWVIPFSLTLFGPILLKMFRSKKRW